MSLVKSPKMAGGKVAANRQNQSLCHGPDGGGARTHARLMWRMQDSSLREVRWFTNLLLNNNRYEGQSEALEKAGLFQDVPETEEVSRLE
jgi:hypothetical protein